MAQKGGTADYYYDGKDNLPQRSQLKIKDPAKMKVTMQPNGGFVMIL